MEWVLSRLSERATWVALIGLATTGLGFMVPGQIVEAIANAGPGLALLAIALLRTPNA
jgi:hypothetical protein